MFQQDTGGGEGAVRSFRLPLHSKWGKESDRAFRRTRRPSRTFSSITASAVLAVSVGLPALTIAQPASGAVTVGENITAFPNRDMVVAVGYEPGDELTVEVLRNGVVIGSAVGPAVDTPEGTGLEVNHGPLGTPVPGDCWNGVTPNIVGGDVIRVTSKGGVDTMTVANVDFVGTPHLDETGNNVVVDGTTTPGTSFAVEFRRDRPTPRFRRGPFSPTVAVDGTWSAMFRPSTTTSAEGLTPTQQRDIAMNEASWSAVVDNITETTIAELGEPGGVGPGCTGTADPNAIAGGLDPINIASGDIVLSGTAKEGTTAVSIKVGALAAKDATLSENLTGVKTWSLPVTKAELSTLPEGNVVVTPSFDGIPGANRTIAKDTVAPAAPTATPPAGTYSTTQAVTLNKAATDRVFYEIGSAPADPDEFSTLFAQQITVSATQTIKAIAVDRAGNTSPVATFAYQIGAPAPGVNAQSPASLETDVALTSNVSATFSEIVQGVNTSTFQLRDDNDALVSATVTRVGTSNEWVLNPNANLAPSSIYTATLTGGPTAIRNAAGGALASRSWSFTTADAPPDPAPIVTGRTPATGATGVSTSGNVTATFSEAVSGVSGTSFTLQSAADAVPAAVTYNATTRVATLDPTANLAPNTTYTATLTGGGAAIRDSVNNPLTTTVWSFTTAAAVNVAPTVTARTPASAATNVAVADNVTATFSEAVQGVSGTTFTLRNTATGAAVPAAVSQNGTTNQWILNPTANLAASTNYTVSLTGGAAAIRDAGNAPLGNTSWAFTTAAANAAPTVTARTPASAATAVSATGNITATFSEAVTGVSGTTFTLRNAATNAAIAAAVTYDAATRVATLNPTANLANDTRYTASLTAGIRDSGSAALAANSWTFTTGPAPTATRSPGTNATGVGATGNITATFNENVTGVSGTTFTLRNATTNAAIAAAVSYNATTRVATLNPTANLANDTRYTATLTGGTSAIRDAAGNPFGTTTWSFTTGPAPTITARAAAVNATAVSRTANVTATFSEAVTGVSGTTFVLRNATTNAVITAVVSRNGTTNQWILNPSATLAANTRFTATLTGGTTAIRDAAGNPLATSSWSFTTGA